MLHLTRAPRPAPVGPAQARLENFPVALRVLPAVTRHHLLAIYRYARYVDDLGDRANGDRCAALQAVSGEVQRLFAGQVTRDAVVASLAETVAACQLPAGPLLRLVEANLQDQLVTRYATFDELVDYCRLSANPVGELVLHVFGQVDADRVALSDRVCTGLQLIEHWQDVAEDRRAGRIYLPKEDLDRFGVTETDLDAPRASPALRALLCFETDRALAWLDAGALLVPALRGWARLAVSGFVAGGRAAVRAMEQAGYDPMSGPPKASSRQVLAAWLRASVRSPG